jgi:anhydro-N-acetylmuramic acid kinase
MIIIGLMSGTSLDGLDIAACKFWKENEAWKYEIKCAETIPYTENEIKSLQHAFHLNGADLIALHHQYGDLIGLEVKKFCEIHDIRPDYIASHGHTIFHQPHKGFTFQLGHGANIAARSGIITICDFRTSDVAYGGQGAPLVPVGDELLFVEYDYCLNLGGISNISFQEHGKRKAFDIGVCNMALNELAKEVNLAYDKDGLIAKSGMIEKDLLNHCLEAAQKSHLNQHSLGYEWYNTVIKPILNASSSVTANKLRTYCEFIALQISSNILKNKKVLVTGGGTKNKFLIDCIQQKCNSKLIIPDNQLIDFKEALIFAFLGMLRVGNQANALRSVTGALNDSKGGCIYLP